MADFTTTLYQVVDIYDFLDYLVSNNESFKDSNSSDLFDTISSSNKVTFGDAQDTLVYALDICNILGCDLPEGVDPKMLIGLGS